MTQPNDIEALAAWRQREVQMIGAAISTRNWHAVEDAYNQLRDKMDAALRAQDAAPVALDAYDAGLLNDFGGGDVNWWQDYIRAELERAHEFYASQFHPSPNPAPAVAADGELLPCPFCLADAEVKRSSRGLWIGCTNCWATEGRVWTHEQEAEAIAAWNTRPTATNGDKDAVIARLADALTLSKLAIDDWLNQYAYDLFDPARVQEAKDRIRKYGGTLAYIATIQDINRTALANRGEAGA